MGNCTAGTDVVACFLAMNYTCGPNLKVYMGIDDCGGHADAYHVRSVDWMYGLPVSELASGPVHSLK